ncbi:MAG: GntG family PLP-dependent aldolase, partial [bacterium]
MKKTAAFDGVVDLRSDTVTRPTPEMRRAMAEAVVGDDVLGDDPTVKELEALAAKTMGKQAGLYVPSGTMGNELAVKSWTHEGDEIILDSISHISKYELSGVSVISRVMPRFFKFERGVPNLTEIEPSIQVETANSMRTSLICLENTHNYHGGAVVPLKAFEDVRKFADMYELRVHLDGARIFNAATAAGVKVTDYAKQVDSVMFCLSKGLSAPIGSMLVGPSEFILRARRFRRMLGGGMRQVGVIAAAGLVSLRTMTTRLHEDHKLAKKLANGLAALPGIVLDPDSVQTN